MVACGDCRVIGIAGHQSQGAAVARAQAIHRGAAHRTAGRWAMRRPECLHEPDVLAALRPDGTLPDDHECRAHVTQCGVCAELLEMTAALRRDHQDLTRGLSVPSSGQVWWRAAVRARIE